MTWNQDHGFGKESPCHLSNMYYVCIPRSHYSYTITFSRVCKPLVILIKKGMHFPLSRKLVNIFLMNNTSFRRVKEESSCTGIVYTKTNTFKEKSLLIQSILELPFSRNADGGSKGITDKFLIVIEWNQIYEWFKNLLFLTSRNMRAHHIWPLFKSIYFIYCGLNHGRTSHQQLGNVSLPAANSRFGIILYGSILLSRLF